ncbi:cupin-like domain-containing protein [Sphingobium sp. HWE2-09]|uniref:cupin-like domain-containing protein n=1 Tax=Sphingobium sp. HWE2-09 TaxID=3108390 RepID=UPI00403ED4EF
MTGVSAASSLDECDASDVGDADALRALALSCRPVVIRGHCGHWPVVAAAAQGPDAAMAYLGHYDAGLTAEYFSAPASLEGRYHYGEGLSGFNFAREAIDVRDALARIGANAGTGHETGYVGSLPTDAYFPGFADDNPSRVLDGHVRPRIWLGNRSTVACHYDSYDNLACVVAGRRRFTLYPPEAIGDLYVGPIDHTLSGQPVSMAAGVAEGAAAYPRFAAARAKAIVVELHPGDALYLPKLWWHQVEALDPVNILVNYWWDGFAAGPDSPYAALLLAMIAIAERPAPERAAWRAYFDHYVFRAEGHPLAHLPQEKHGVLGPLAQGNYGRIRTLVMRMLRGG